ncbi:MAG: molybdate ABC transporter substrate-binding protein, partial [Cyclobacteriaceae bacterium]|nr:molybdate ABC transporter substrate-binding protein [Cyclobacteriaceae bacterium]
MLALVSCRKTSPVDIRVASAANVQQAMEEIARSFEAETGWKAGIIPGSSGKLTAQIEQGAPYDVFVSADTLYPNALHAMQRTIGSPVTYAHGTLVLWWRDSSLQMDYSRLADAQISHIALPNPKTAPYGRAALQALEKSGYLSALAPRLIYGESV